MKPKLWHITHVGKWHGEFSGLKKWPLTLFESRSKSGHLRPFPLSPISLSPMLSNPFVPPPQCDEIMWMLGAIVIFPSSPSHLPIKGNNSLFLVTSAIVANLHPQKLTTTCPVENRIMGMLCITCMACTDMLLVESATKHFFLPTQHFYFLT